MVTTEERQYIRGNIKENCILRLTYKDTELAEAKFVETLNYSKGGLAVIYNGEGLSVGHKFSVYIESLNIIRKLCQVAWSKKLNGDRIEAGLEWV